MCTDEELGNDHTNSSEVLVNTVDSRLSGMDYVGHLWFKCKLKIHLENILWNLKTFKNKYNNGIIYHINLNQFLLQPEV